MKFEISKDGLLTLLPENSIEEFAMKAWKSASYVQQRNDLLSEDGFYKGSSIQVIPYSIWRMQNTGM